MSISPNYQSDNSYYSLDFGLSQYVEEELQELQGLKVQEDIRSCISPGMFDFLESESASESDDVTHAEFGNIDLATNNFPGKSKSIDSLNTSNGNAGNKFETPAKLTSDSFRPQFFEPNGMNGVSDTFRSDVPIPDVPIPRRFGDVVPVLATMNDEQSNIRDYKKSALVHSLVQYGKDGLRQNEGIVECMHKLHREIVEFDHTDFFPPNNNNAQFDNNDDIKFRVPAYANHRCSSSYSDLTVSSPIY